MPLSHDEWNYFDAKFDELSKKLDASNERIVELSAIVADLKGQLANS